MTIEYLREFKLFNYAIFDFAVSFLGIYLLAPLLSKIFSIFGLKISRKSWMYLTLPVSILVHMLVGNITPMTKDFFDLGGHYILKVIILSLLFFGLRNIKKNK